jgi:integrase
VAVEFGNDGRRELREDETLIEYYLNIREKELEEGTKESYRTAWRSFEKFRRQKGYQLSDIGKNEAIEWCSWLKEEMSQNGGETYVGMMRSMVRYLTNTPAIETNANPFQQALNTDPFSYDKETNKIEIPLPELRKSIHRIDKPRRLFLVVTYLKTGLRLSELVNLDERDVNIDHPISEDLDSPRKKLKGKPNSLYVDSSVSEGEKHNGELRKQGNKPNSYRTIPLDEETVELFAWYLARRAAPNSPANPVITGNGGRGSQIGSRLQKPRVTAEFIEWAEENKWPTGKDGGMSPHWCRHWFTTVLRTRIDPEEVPIGSPKEYVQGLRGDTADGIIETYTQDWENEGKSYEEIYRDNIPKLLRVDIFGEGDVSCPKCGREPPEASFSTIEEGGQPLCNPCAREEYVLDGI